jgi:hypothetical protein
MSGEAASSFTADELDVEDYIWVELSCPILRFFFFLHVWLLSENAQELDSFVFEPIATVWIN